MLTETDCNLSDMTLKVFIYLGVLRECQFFRLKRCNVFINEHESSRYSNRTTTYVKKYTASILLHILRASEDRDTLIVVIKLSVQGEIVALLLEMIN